MMTTADKSPDEKTATQEGPDKPGTLEEVDFPAVEETPTAAELEALLNQTAPTTDAETSVVEKKDDPAVNVEKPASARNKWAILFAGVFLAAVSIAAFIYLRNQPKPVPT